MVFTPSGIFVVEKPWISLFVAVSMMALQLSRESYLGLFGSISNEVMLSHPPKGESPKSVIPADSFTVVRSTSAQKAAHPIDVTLLGRLTSFSPRLPLKAVSPMAVTVSGMTVVLQPMRSVLVAVSMMALQLLRESNTGLPASTLSPSRLSTL